VTFIDTSLLTFHPFVSRGYDDAFYVQLPSIDFNLDSQYSLQTEAVLQLQHLKHQFQSLYLDASAINSGTTFVSLSPTQQSVAILSGYQGYRPVICTPGTQQFVFSNPGAFAAGAGPQVLKVYLLNVPVIGVSWGVNAESGGGSASAVWG
jgi:hypothetical protein